MIAASLTICAIGFAMIVLGIRGRTVGTDPHCRRCGYNLRGRNPASAECPECGSVVTNATVRHGLRRRRPVVMVLGLLLSGLGGTWLGVGLWAAASEYDWAPWKTMGWLVSDLDSSDARTRNEAKRELLRRIEDPSVSQTKIDWLVDRALDRQADLSKPWDPAFGDLIESAIGAQRVDDERLRRYFRQGVTVTLEIRPKLRRQQLLPGSLNIRLSRFGARATFRGEWTTSPFTVGGVEGGDFNYFNSHGERELRGLSMGFTTDLWKWDKLADGKHEVRGTLKLTMAMQQPAMTAPITLDLDFATPVEVFPADAVVDDFVVDEALRERMHGAISIARVFTDDDAELNVGLKVEALPMAVAWEVILVQGSDEQPLGTMLLKVGKDPRWSKVRTSRKRRFSGLVDVHLRPSQRVADSQRKLGTYWGEPIVIAGVEVDAPYDPPFLRDESLRAQVESSLLTPTITRRASGSPRLIVYLRADRPPVKLAYSVVLVWEGQEVKVGNWRVRANQSDVYLTSVSDFTPAGEARECDVVLRPNLNWEVDSFDLAPPWYGEVIIRNVKIESSGSPAAVP